jgi:hypothetical protein
MTCSFSLWLKPPIQRMLLSASRPKELALKPDCESKEDGKAKPLQHVLEEFVHTDKVSQAGASGERTVPRTKACWSVASNRDSDDR